jgi:multiple sugar transport system permease protein
VSDLQVARATTPELTAAQLRALAKAGTLEETRYQKVTAGALSSNALLAVLGIAFLLPLIWVVFASIDAHAGAGVRIPNPSLQHYRAMAHESRLRPFYNSLYLAGVSTVVSTVLGLFASYALSRRHIPFKRTLMLLILFMSGLPVTMLLVPVYQMFVQLNWINSMFWTSMFIAASSLPFTIWLLKNFIDQVPRELEEAAAIEGTSNLQIVLRVVIPLATPGILVTSLVAFINAWGAFVIPLVLDSNPNDTPGSIAIYQFLTENGQIHFGDLAAYSILFAVPVVILYLFASRRISGAFTFAGGIKA